MRQLLVITAAVMVACVALGLAGCGGSPSSPSVQPQLIEGTISLLAGGTDVVNFTATRAGTLSASVNWTSAESDVDIFLVKANCSVANLVAESAGCAESDTVASARESREASRVFDHRHDRPVHAHFGQYF